MWASMPANDLPVSNGHPHGRAESNGAGNSYLDHNQDAASSADDRTNKADHSVSDTTCKTFQEAKHEANKSI